MLKFLLNIKDNRMLKQEYVALLIEPYIDAQGKPRLIEPPNIELKVIQSRIKAMLSKIFVPQNVFSGVKGRSYTDNAKMHKGVRYLYKIDLTAFFPSIKRETVYTFFSEDLQCSSDVAEALTNFTTIDIIKSSTKDFTAIKCFLDFKKIKTYNHLISGSPTSPILSYLVNHTMFEELQTLADENSITMTIYIDDITFSSEYFISHKFKGKAGQIIKKYDYQISKKKVKSYSKLYPKLVTGVIIDPSGKMMLKNSLRCKIITEYKNLRENPCDAFCRNRLRGLITAAKQVDAGVFPSIHKFTFTKSETSFHQ